MSNAAAPTRFDRDTAVEHVSAGVYRATFDDGWRAVVGPHGGYVAAIVLRAMQHALGDVSRSPRSLHLRYLTPAVPGSIELHVRTLRAGRSVTALEARIVQAGKEVCVASAVFGVRVSQVAYCDARMPEVPAPEACALVPKMIPINHRFDMRQAIGGALRKSERALGGGWMRLEEPRMPDALLMAVLWDAWLPVPLYRQLDTQFGGAAPTIEASIYFRAALPLKTSTPQDHFLVRFESACASEGYFEESGEVWSADGVLLVQSRQLALLY